MNPAVTRIRSIRIKHDLSVLHRFALVCVGSDSSSRKLMDLLSKRDLHGQNPIVTPCNKQSLSQFEMQSRKSETNSQTYQHICCLNR